MTSTLAMDTSDDVERFASLERRVADLEGEVSRHRPGVSGYDLCSAGWRRPRLCS